MGPRMDGRRRGREVDERVHCAGRGRKARSCETPQQRPGPDVTRCLLRSQQSLPALPSPFPVPAAYRFKSTANMTANITLTFLGTTSGGGPTETRNCSSLVLEPQANRDLWSTSSYSTRSHPRSFTASGRLCRGHRPPIRVAALPRRPAPVAHKPGLQDLHYPHARSVSSASYSIPISPHPTPDHPCATPPVSQSVL